MPGDEAGHVKEILSDNKAKIMNPAIENGIIKKNSSLKAAPVLSIEEFEGVKLLEPGQQTEIVKESFFDKFKKSQLDQTKEYALPVPVISIAQNGIELPLMTLKSFSLWQGKQKSKKTTVLALAVAAFITRINTLDDIYFSRGMDGVVLFFDNEQGESYAARTMRLILKLAGLETSDKLIYCDLREHAPNERRKIIEAGIQGTPNVKLVIIDGLVDLLNDFMDAMEGHLTATDLLKLCSTYDIHIAGVLHQNKADKNARAHIGTISSQKCEMEISTEVDPNDKAQSIVTCVNSRGIPFEQFAIRWDKGLLPCIKQDYNKLQSLDQKANKNYSHHEDIVSVVFKPLSALAHTEAVEGIMNAAKKSESTAKRYLGDYLKWQLITKGEDEKYRKSNKTNSEGSRVHEGSKEGS